MQTSQTSQTATPASACPVIIQIGDKGDTVKLLQRKLTGYGFPTTVDGIFGKNTQNSVKAFQLHYGLQADGIVGSQTWHKLGVC